jgi:hypothetical protein
VPYESLSAFCNRAASIITFFLAVMVWRKTSNPMYMKISRSLLSNSTVMAIFMDSKNTGTCYLFICLHSSFVKLSLEIICSSLAKEHTVAETVQLHVKCHPMSSCTHAVHSISIYCYSASLFA